jgi:hypothetical protein
MSDCRRFPALKKHLGYAFKDDGELETVITRRLLTHDRDFYQQAMKFFPRYDKNLNCRGGGGVDYVEKQWNSYKIKS